MLGNVAAQKANEYWTILSTPPFVYIFIFAIAVFTLGIIGRILSGFSFADRASRGIFQKIFSGNSSALGKMAVYCYSILMLYVVCILMFRDGGYSDIFVNGLPFVVSSAADVSSLYFHIGDFWSFMLESSHIFFLAVMVALVSFPVEKLVQLTSKTLAAKAISIVFGFLVWYFFQCLIVFAAMFVNTYILQGIMEKISNSFIAKWLPVLIFILFIVAIVLRLLSVFARWIPFLGNSFFTKVFSFLSGSFLGKTICSCMYVTLALMGLALFLHQIEQLKPLIGVVYIFTQHAPLIILFLVIMFLTWMLVF